MHQYLTKNLSIGTSEQELKRIEWLLQPNPDHIKTAVQPYGDLTELNSERTLLDAVGSDVLHDIAGDYLDLLGTWTCIFETGGDYALNKFACGWCRLLDQASRRECDTDDNRIALSCGNWHFHESRWDISKATMERGEPMDAECPAGLRIFAAPIRARGEIIGAISFGYGDPPRDMEKLQKIATRLHVDMQDLIFQSDAYASRPPFIIEMAKRRLLASARLIGEIAERKQLENEHRKLESQLRQAQKLEAVGTLPGGIAHDFNNILSSIIGYSELALMDAASDSMLANSLNQINRAGFRARDLVRQILAFSRQNEKEQVPVWAKLLIKEAMKLLRASIPASIEIREDLRSESLTLGDPSQIHQILMNLCTNAVQAMTTQKGCIRVVLEDVEIDEKLAGQYPDANPGKYLKLTIADDGPGIPMDIQCRIFDPFFTTKSEGQGTGLGLSVVHGIVHNHKGFILVDSPKGKGTTFCVYLPVADISNAPEQDQDQSVPTGTERILFIDDEPQIAELGEKLLQKLGYHVETQTSGTEAIKIVQSKPDAFDLIITDMTMPHRTGIDLAKTVKKVRPDLPIILCTGFSSLIDEEKASQLGFSAFLYKPITKNKIATTIRRVLDEG